MGLVGLLEIGGAGSASSVISGASDLFFTKYSRHQETLADEFGLEVLNKYYGHVDGAVNTFELLRDKHERLLTLNGILSTHPITDQRMEHLENLIEQNKFVNESNGLVPYEFNPSPPDNDDQSDGMSNTQDEAKIQQYNSTI